MSPKCPFRINAVPPYNAVTDGGCTADGATDDRANLQASITAAVAAGKRLYLPAGTYHMHPSSNIGLTIPSNLYMYGDGATTILELYDDGTDDLSEFLKLANGTSYVTLKNLKLTGTVTAGASYPSQYPSVMGIVCYGVNVLTVTGVTFDKCQEALKVQSGTNTSFEFDNVTTLANVLQPFYMQSMNGLTISNSTLAAATLGQQAGRYMHHFYINDNTINLNVHDCTLSGGQHAWGGHGAVGTYNIYFTDIVLDNIYDGYNVNGGTGEVIFDGFTTTNCTRCSGYPWWMIQNGANNVVVKNFTLTGPTNLNAYLTYNYRSSGSAGNNNTFTDGTVNYCNYWWVAAPKGCQYTVNPPIYSNVTINQATG